MFRNLILITSLLTLGFQVSAMDEYSAFGGADYEHASEMELQMTPAELEFNEETAISAEELTFEMETESENLLWQESSTHERNFRPRRGKRNGRWGKRWPRRRGPRNHRVVCWARNGRGHTFRAVGRRPRFVQQRAIDKCYSYSRFCRSLGCERRGGHRPW